MGGGGGEQVRKEEGRERGEVEREGRGSVVLRSGLTGSESEEDASNT